MVGEGEMILRVVLPLMPPRCAVIWLVPSETAVSRPPELMMANALLSVDQVTALDKSSVLASVYVPVA